MEVARLLVGLAQLSMLVREQLEDDHGERKELRRELHELRMKFKRCAVFPVACMQVMLAVLLCAATQRCIKMSCPASWQLHKNVTQWVVPYGLHAGTAYSGHYNSRSCAAPVEYGNNMGICRSQAATV